MNKLKELFSGNLFLRLPIQERINFSQHLAIVIKAGLPLLEGLRVIRRQTHSKTLARIIDQLMVDLNNGKFLADSLERYKAVFGEFYISIVRIGEASGTLGTNLVYLAEEIEKAKDLRSKVRGALVYPVIILIATLGITGLITFFIFPKVLPIFSSLRVELPTTTKAVIWIFNFLLAYGWYFLAAIVGLIILFRLALFWKPFQFMMHRALFYVPVISGLVVNVNMANFTRIFRILLKSGIKIVEATTTTSKTFSNLVYQRALLQAAEEIRKGEQFSKGLNQLPQLFPPLLAGMIEIGENTGNLEENLSYLSEYYSKAVDSSVRSLTGILEPLLILVMGLVVGFVSLSIITPIYSLTQTLGQ
ncbi:type II secretion system F family protein [Candidatus Parcubacteria bacterium]|nr:MAG: type II secretion system F family protein [Candidatus Parcubacteria bacterium]